jgi:nucleotide-binding universal stress UspA family protein
MSLKLKKILVPTDLSTSSRAAADVAADLATRFDASLDLLHVSVYHQDGPLAEWFKQLFSDPESQKKREKQVLAKLEEEMRRHLGSPEPRVKQIDIEADRVAPTIVSYANDHGSDLIVMGTHGHRAADHALGGTAGEVLRTANRSVLVVRDRDHDGPVSFSHILVPVDFSEVTGHSLRVAAQLAELYNARLSVCFVAEELTVPMFSDTGIPAVQRLTMAPEDVANAGRALRSLVDRELDSDREVATHVLGGTPAREIASHARSKEVDLIVMAAHGHSGGSKVTVGSVTEGVARRTRVPVLILEPTVATGAG